MEEYKSYLDQRCALNEAEFRVAESCDKALLTLSGGALAVSMTFVTDIAKNPIWTWALITAWILFGLTITILLLTFCFCQQAYKKQREILDADFKTKVNKQNNNTEQKNEVKEKINIWSTLTKIGNLIAIVLFSIGLIFLGIFIGINIQNRLVDKNEQRTTNTQAITTETNT